MRLIGHLDFPTAGTVCPSGEPLEIVGWGFFDKTPAAFIEMRLDDRVLAFSPLREPREDVIFRHPVARSFGAPLGFRAFLPLSDPVPPGPHTLEVVLWSADGKRASLPALPLMITPKVTAGNFSARFSVVPKHLVRKVNAQDQEAVFQAHGFKTVAVMEEHLGLPWLRTVRRALDFGCGLGRVLAPLKQKLPQARFWGMDIDPRMLRWLEFLHGAGTAEPVPSTLDLPDRSFDLIYAISVFTHLADQSDFWLSETARLLRHGGRAFLTYHDETLFDEVINGPRREAGLPALTLSERSVLGNEAAEGDTAMGTFYTTAAWEQKLRRFFVIEKTVPRGLFGHQSFSIVRRTWWKRPERVPLSGYAANLEQTLQRQLDLEGRR